MLYLRAFGVWLLLVVCAILNGALREAVLLPALGRPAAPLLSGLLLSGLTIALALAFARRLGAGSDSRSMSVGVFWLALTVVFEFAFGGLVERQTWPEMLEAYTFRDGNIWPLVLAVILFAPLLAHRLRGRERERR